MKIGFFYIHPPNESMGSLNRLRVIVQGLDKLNHTCYIFTLSDFNFKWGRNVKFVNISSSSFLNRLDIFKKVYPFIRKILTISSLSYLTVLNSYLLKIFVKNMSNKILTYFKKENFKFDLLIGEQEIACLIISRIKKKLRIPLIFDYHNFWPEELVEKDIIKKKSKKYNYLLNLEEEIIKKADLIITNGIYLRDYLNSLFDCGNHPKIISIPIGSTPFLNKPKIKNFPPKIINAGMIVKRSNLRLFLKSIPYILEKYPKIKVFITEKGDEIDEIKSLARKMGLKINFYWKESYKEFIDFLSDFHVGIITSEECVPRKLGIPTKMIDYFSVGIPIVGNDIGGWSSIIQEEQVGLISQNDPKDLAKKILYLLDNENLIYKYGENAIQLIKSRFNNNVITKKLSYEIEKLNSNLKT